MTRLFALGAMVCLAAATVEAPVKIAGTITCRARSVQQLSLPVGDQPDHVITLSQGKCAWTKPFLLGGSPVKESTEVNVTDAAGGAMRGYGYDIGAVASGDKYFVRYEAASRLQNGIVVGGSGTWSFTGGTGKLSRLQGSGTYTCKGSAAGSSCDIVGQAMLSATAVPAQKGGY